MSASESGDDSGRIPFRIRIGVTGHRDLDDPGGLEPPVTAQVRRIASLFAASHTEVRLAAVSQLAEGADRLVVERVLAVAGEHGDDARLEVVLPVRSDRYAELQRFSEGSRREFERLLDRATVVTVVPEGSPDGGADYELSARQVVDRCDVLIALWDGERSGGKGGTAETLLYAAALSKPCVWIPTAGEPAVRDNLGDGAAQAFHDEVRRRALARNATAPAPLEHPRSTLKPLRHTFALLDEFNREPAPRELGARLGAELRSGEGVAGWVAAPYTRATLLAARWQRRFARAAWGISVLATAAAAALGIGLSFGEGSTLWPWAEAACLAAALVGLAIVRRRGLHRRWLSYRLLSERLRAAHYLAPTGADLHRHAGLEGMLGGDRSEEWMMRAFEEVWDRRPRNGASGAMSEHRLASLKRTLADEWIGSQIAYHEAAARRHRRQHLLMSGAVTALFAGTVVFAVLHAHHVAEDLSTLLSITLPAAGASLGAILTTNQHHALSERSRRMAADLEAVRGAVLVADEHTLDKASAEAARAIAQEAGAWFGAMWFLDIEHP